MVVSPYLDLDGDGDSLTTTQTKHSDATPQVTPAERKNQSNQQARARGAEWMTERNRAAIDIRANA